MLIIGYDIGSSSVKASLFDAAQGKVLAAATSPKTELPIEAPQAGWAQQHPDTWWLHLKNATAELAQNVPSVSLKDVRAVGISYQMHGLVLVDKDLAPIRPAIIWCDSRAVAIGQKAFQDLGPQTCLTCLLNSPGNFTASKLKWVMLHEPENYHRTRYFMLPGDYIALKLTGEAHTTASGLSEGILWDFAKQSPAELLLNYYGIEAALIPPRVPTFAPQGKLSAAAATELGLSTEAVVAYRAGDQPNNALSLNVLEPGELAATAGTSGVVYGITESMKADPQSRVNIFAHVNHTPQKPRAGVLLCLNGTGILNSWIKHNLMAAGQDYPQMNEIAQQAPIGSEGLVVLPYGNGAERTLGNQNPGACFANINFNRHGRAHLLRAAQEGIVFALNYGCEIMNAIGVKISTVRAGYANMFLSPLFASAFATVTNAAVELYNTDGAQGAARGAGIGIGFYASAKQAFAGLRSVQTIEPRGDQREPYLQAYQSWLKTLNRQLENS